jgi:hypothetical protein
MARGGRDILTIPRPRVGAAMALAAVLFLVYGSNGREIGSVDTQPAKFGARALVEHHTLRLDRDVLKAPGLADRPAFAKDLQGHYRSAYSVVPSIIAAVPAWLLSRTHLIDLDGPFGPNVVATTTAALVMSVAIALVFVVLCRLVSVPVALFASAGLGLGTNLWAAGSRTLGGIDVVACGLALALWAWLRPGASITRRHAVIGGIGVALALSTRLQVAPIAVVLLAWMSRRVGTRRTLPAIVPVVAAVLALCTAQYLWFGNVAGASLQLEAVHPATHGVPGSLSHTPWVGAIGLLISPSRGLFVFSPITLLAIAGVRADPVHADRDLRLRWLFTAAVLQWLAYSCYAVWWAGHTFGPRYMLDLLVPLAPFIAFGAEMTVRRPLGRGLAALVLGWSVAVAATGAFVYPNDRWNDEPVNVDVNHDRLWDWRDSQILRCWGSGLSPHNFDLFREGAPTPPQSARKAIIGSTRVARRAGTSVAMNETPVTSAMTDR